MQNDFTKSLLQRLDPTYIMKKGGFEAANWQREFLASTSNRILLLCPRQVGKSESISVLALNRALNFPGRPVLIIAPKEDQAQETLRKVKHYLRFMVNVNIKECKIAEKKIELPNGSRIIALPDKDTIRGASNASMVALDEASRLSDSIYAAVEPMVGKDTKFIMASTPFGKKGLFFNTWERLEKPVIGKKNLNAWHKIKVTIYDCLYRYSKDVIEAKKTDINLSKKEFNQEYMCEFVDTVDNVFDRKLVDAAFSDEVIPHVFI